MRAFVQLLAAALVHLAAAAPAHAWDGVRCVQAQLNALGYNAGAVDGQAGPATRRALATYEDVVGVLTPRKLDRDSAIVHCRKLGQRHLAARALWPSAAKRYTIVTTDGISDADRRRAEGALISTMATLKNRYGVELAGSFTMVVGTSPRALRRAGEPHLPAWVNRAQLETRLRENCGRGGFTGVALPGVFFVCQAKSDTSGRPVSGSSAFAVVRHEFFHEVQLQYMGWTPHRSEAELLRHEGPMWLIEGAAEVAPQGRASYRADRVAIAREVFGDKRVPDLRKLEMRTPARAADEGLYLLGYFAVQDLVAGPKGVGGLIEFYERLGDGRTWDKAFERTFVMTPFDFYARFEAQMKPPPS